MPDFAELKYDGKTYKIPVITGTENEHGLDIGNLRAETGLITLDTGYKNTGSTKSKITFLDGEKGILRYRGFPIEQLAEKSNFIEVAYLLMYGELPSKEQYEKFQFNITHHTLIHEDMKKFFDAYPSTAHPMGLLTAMTSSLSSFYPESLDPNRSEAMKELFFIIHMKGWCLFTVEWAAAFKFPSRSSQLDAPADDIGQGQAISQFLQKTW